MTAIAYSIALILFITNIVTALMLFKIKHERKIHHQYDSVLREWIKIHFALQKNQRALLEIKKIDSENLMHWKP